MGGAGLAAAAVSAHLPRFLIAAAAALGEVVRLAAEEARHARVRRLGAGEAVALFDGAGHACEGVVETLTRDAIAVRVTRVLPPRLGESALSLTLAIGLLKADKLDWVIEKATELGATRIQPFASAFTLAQPSAARQERWRHVALSAAKQCGRSVVPEVALPVAFAALLAQPAAARLMCAEHGETAPLAALRLEAPASALLVVGAEGGFAAAEIEAARSAGFHAVGLGPRVLRAETAAVAATALCQARWGDLAAPG